MRQNLAAARTAAAGRLGSADHRRAARQVPAPHDQRRDFRYVKLDKPAADASPVSDDEIQAYYKEHTQEFVTPERVSLDYVELDGSKLEVNATPDDAALKDRYEKEKSRFVSAEQRLASHILVKVGGKAGPGRSEAALAKAEGIAKEAKAGKDFAALAKQDSDDLGSKNQGGDLGWLEKGTTDEAFESALFAMNKGDISDPVLTADGYQHHPICATFAPARRGASRTSRPSSPRNTRRPNAIASIPTRPAA